MRDIRYLPSELLLRWRITRSDIARLPALFMRGIGRDISHVGVSTIASRVLTLAASILIARWLGVAGFGRYGMVQATLGALGVVAGAGLGITLTKSIAETTISEQQRSSQIISLILMTSVVTGSIIASVAFLLAPWLSTRVLSDASLEFPVRITSPIILLNTLNGVQLGVLAGFQAFRTIAIVSFAGTCLALMGTVVGAYLGDLAGAFAGLSIAAVANCIICTSAVRGVMKRRALTLSFSGAWQHRSILWSFSLPSLSSHLLVEPVNWLCATLVVHATGGYDQLGGYYVANQWLTALVFLPRIIAYVVFPRLTQAFAQQKGPRAFRMVALSTGLNAAVTLPPALVIALMSASIMGFYNPALAAEWPVLTLTVVTAVLMALVAPIGEVVAAAGRMWVGAAVNLAWATSFIGLTMALLSYGALGLAVARAGAYAMHLAWSTAVAGRLINLLPSYSIDKPDPARSV
jgi:O-antigen/teichoic acid export membrane protein